MVLAAVAGGVAPQSWSISRSVETSSFASRSRIASSERCLTPPSASGRSRSTTSSGPRSRKSIRRAATVPRPTTIAGEVNALLVSDREREYTVGLLRGHWLSGRLTADEFEQRVGEAWRARFSSDLWHALRALPVDAPPVPRVPPRGRSGVGSLVLAITALCLLFM